MAKKRKPRVNEKELTKGQVRKLNALRKSLGQDIADRAFLDWLGTVAVEQIEREDKNARLIAEALEPLIKQKKLSIPRGGYLVTRGRGRVIVTRAAEAV